MRAKGFREIVKHLAENLSLEVNFVKGACPSTNGKVVTLPIEVAEKYVNILLSAVVHEAAGHGKNTDFKVVRNNRVGQWLFLVWNTLEDIRVDTKTLKKYPNAIGLFKMGIRWLFVHKKKEMLEDKWVMKVLKGIIFIAHEIDPKEIYTETMVLGKIALVKNFVQRAKDAKSTEETLELAKELMKILSQEAIKEKKKEEQQSGKCKQGKQGKEKQKSKEDSQGQSGKPSPEQGQSGEPEPTIDDLENYSSMEEEKEKAQKELNARRDAYNACGKEQDSNHRKRKLHTTKKWKIDREERQNEQQGQPSKALQEKSKKKEERLNELQKERETLEKKSQELYEKYSEANATAEKANGKIDKIEKLLDKILEEGFGQNANSNLLGFDGLPSDINEVEVDYQAELDYLIKEGLLAKQEKEVQEEEGSALNTQNIGELFTAPELLWTETKREDKKTFVSFVLDVSSSMGYSHPNWNYATCKNSEGYDTSSKMDLAGYAMKQLGSALKKAIDEGAPADFNVYAFGTNFAELIPTYEAFEEKKLLQGLDKAQGVLGGSTNLTKAINYVSNQLQEKDAKHKCIILLTDADVGEDALKELQSRVYAGDVRWIAVAIIRSEYNDRISSQPEFAEIFRDYIIRDADNAPSILVRALSEVASINL